jgi:hypothetical protein
MRVKGLVAASQSQGSDRFPEPLFDSHWECSGLNVGKETDLRIPTKSAADSEQMQPPLGAERRKLSDYDQ